MKDSQQQLKLKPGKALVIVAHPDDETIWMGGTIMKNPQVDWTIFSLCRASDKDRAPKFKIVCKYLKAKPIITDLIDEGKMRHSQHVSKIKKTVLEKIKNKKFDYIFTHGINGEYGHPRHVGVHLAVKELIQKRKLNYNFAFCFNYCKISRRAWAPLRPKKDSSHILNLTACEFKKKKDIMTKLYGFDPKGIDANLCTKQEGFKKIKGKL